MPDTDSHGRPIIVAARWFSKLPAQPRKLKPGERPTVQLTSSESSSDDGAATDGAEAIRDSGRTV